MFVVFDVDGTLTETTELDARLYARVFREVFGAPLPSTRWDDYENATDQGIALEAVTRAGLDSRRIPEFERRFVEELGPALAVAPARQIPGAAAFLDVLSARGYPFAFATGAWPASARAKLHSAGIDIRERVLVGSGLQASREAILGEVLQRAPRPGPAVYLGDGAWDVRAARRLALPFVGVDRHGTRALLRAGARELVPDFLDVEAVLGAIRRASVPA